MEIFYAALQRVRGNILLAYICVTATRILGPFFLSLFLSSSGFRCERGFLSICYFY